MRRIIIVSEQKFVYDTEFRRGVELMTKNEQENNPRAELLNILLGFTDDQWQRFLSDPITSSILRPEEVTEPGLPEAS